MTFLSPQTLLPAMAAVTLAALLVFGELKGNSRAKWLFKPLTSACFVMAALLQMPRTRYDWLIVAGLMLSMAGDVALIRRDRHGFLTGLAAFLLGHLAYIAAFASRASLVALHPAALAVIAIAGVVVFRYFRPRLGGMARPVAAYVTVISLMLAGAWAVMTRPGGDAAGWLIASGATLFYLSDFTVARDRFVPGAGYLNRGIGLVLYYVAQFLLAFSIGR